MIRKEAAEAIKCAMKVWDDVYSIALKNTGSIERAEQLTRAYMSGWLRTHKRYAK